MDSKWTQVVIYYFKKYFIIAGVPLAGYNIPELLCGITSAFTR